MNHKPAKIVILGGGFGGLYTSLGLSNNPLVKSGRVTVTLVEAKETFLFTPLLYEVLTQELRTWEIAPSYVKLLKKRHIQLCQSRVVDIKLESRQVILENQERLEYDYLAIAVGSETRPLPIPGATKQVMHFRSLRDTQILETKLKRLEMSKTKDICLAVLGGGANGVELACKLADRLGDRGIIYLLEKGSTILKHFSPGVQKAASKALSRRRIRLITEAAIQGIEAGKILLENNYLSTDLILWTGGTQSRRWIKELPCQHNQQGKILTYPTLQLLNYPEVFAIGDVASIVDSNIPNTAQAAYQASSCLAYNLLAVIRGKKLRRFRYLHLGDMLTLGKKAAVISSFGINLEGKLADKLRRLIYVFRMPTWGHRFQVLHSVLRNSWHRRLRGFRGRVLNFFSIS